MEIISIKKLHDLYNQYKSEYGECNHQDILKFYYLNLSLHLSRDEREFDKSNYKLFSNLISKKKIKNYIFFNFRKKITGFSNYLFSFKEYVYLPSLKLPLVFLIDILKFGKQILDILGIIVIFFLLSLRKSTVNYKNEKSKLENQKIYSIYYWNKKKSESASYYYPAIDFSNGDKAFISSFADSRLFCLGLINSLKNTNFISPVKILNIKGLLKSIFQFIHLFIYDFCKSFYEKNCNFLVFWFGWKKAAEIFYSILSYNSLKSITSKSSNCEFITWHENQITNRAFALGVSQVLKQKSSNSLISFNGSLFSQQIKNQFLPINSEVNIGFWGQKYYLQDEGSLKEMESYLKKNNIYIPLEVVPISMNRIKNKIEDNFSKSKTSRDITIFTHASYWDLIACLLSIFNKKNKKLFPKYSFTKNKKIFIRLHPALTKKKALKEIKSIKEFNHIKNLEFIDNDKESFLTSLYLSQYSFFGESSNVNLALEKKFSVFAVETNHIKKPPIQLKLIDSPNLTFISPW